MGADNQAEKVMDRIARLEAAEAEIERLRERIGPQGLEVVLIDDTGHYVNAKVKAEIERLRAEKENALATQNLMADEIERLRANTTQDQSLIGDLLLEKKLLNTEVEQLRAEIEHLRANAAYQNGLLEAEVGRLRQRSDVGAKAMTDTNEVEALAARLERADGGWQPQEIRTDVAALLRRQQAEIKQLHRELADEQLGPTKVQNQRVEIERLNSKLEFNERGYTLLQAQKEAADAEIERLRTAAGDRATARSALPALRIEPDKFRDPVDWDHD